MILNEPYSFSDVRYLISSKVGQRMPVRDRDGNRSLDGPPVLRQISYDVELSFIGHPQKTLLPAGNLLVRLDFPVTFGIFMNVWWMRKAVLDSLLQSKDLDCIALRREWQNLTALPKASKGIRTRMIEIALTQEVYAWVGEASPLFHKHGGAEQVYLPNLAKGAGPDRSDYARLSRTGTVSAI